MFRTVLSLALFSAPSALVAAASYRLTDNWQGSSFWGAFGHQAISDPTNGRVQYVSESVARSANLTYTSDSPSPHIIIRADASTYLSPSGAGRRSVRVQSYKQFGHNTVLVADILHVPQGCGTWPALWTTADPWPNKGEIDIIEGVNNVSPNQITLHTTSGCSMPAGRSQTGTDRQRDCDWQVNGNAGCGVGVNKANSYGPSFNAAGGGIYAVERTPTEIKAWFWPRQEINAGFIPGDIQNLGQSNVNTGGWGTPVARFTNAQCDINNHFGPNNIIINLTFCGDWAGNANVYSSSGCPGSCVDYVNNNPSAFRDAYWDIRAIRMYGL